MRLLTLLFTLLIICSFDANLKGQDHSVARKWNEIVLEAIRNDFARPTVHARNLFHTSIAMYDAWALSDSGAETYLLGKKIRGFQSTFKREWLEEAYSISDVEEILSYAVYHIILHRYSESPDFEETKYLADSLMSALGYDTHYSSTDLSAFKMANIGNFLALEIIKFGFLDGANEQGKYVNQYYKTVNPPLDLTSLKPFTIADPNRWQPLLFERFIDQSGNLLSETVPDFLSPEWGDVTPFALEESDFQIKSRNGETYKVALDPGPPPLMGENSEYYKWGFSLVSKWSSHLTSNDTTYWDISPASIGNIQEYPDDYTEYDQFYPLEGGDSGKGHIINPITGKPYENQWVKRGDYTRVLAEFWADGPDSETPPGHWFAILNYVKDHPEFSYHFGSSSILLDPLEYDVKSYFLLGGAMHDAAIAAWSVKGWYDYIRPISAIRYMASLGQSSDSSLPHFHPDGIPLVPGYIELIEAGDPEFSPEDEGKIKVYAWRGHDFIDNPQTDKAGVGWILAENWWPYQRPSFVTPPFAGYVSGHSTYSSAAAEIMSFITNSIYFPGGMGEFLAKKNEYLVFEKGPSEDVILQWATYKDAADQCSLSRIWGGIHPPADDIPGRKMGLLVGKKAIRHANQYFLGSILEDNESNPFESLRLFPNPVVQGEEIFVETNFLVDQLDIFTLEGRKIFSDHLEFPFISISSAVLTPGIYIVTLSGKGVVTSSKLVVLSQ